MVCVFKIVVSDPKTRRTYQKEVGEKESGLLGRKIRDKAKGDFLGLAGYELEITGGSDKQGFPMRQGIHGTVRKKVLLTHGPGFNPLRTGERRRKLVRGDTVSEEIVQVNMKALTYGKDSLSKLFGKEEAKEEKKEAKHEEKHKKEEEHKAEQKEHKTEHAEKKHEEAKAEHKEHVTEQKEHKAEHIEHEKKAEHAESKEHEHKAEHGEHKAEKKE